MHALIATDVVACWTDEDGQGQMHEYANVGKYVRELCFHPRTHHLVHAQTHAHSLRGRMWVSTRCLR